MPDLKLDIGQDLTWAHGARANPKIGRKAAEKHHKEIEEVLGRADLVFVTAGEGGGTGRGAAPAGAPHRLSPPSPASSAR